MYYLTCYHKKKMSSPHNFFNVSASSLFLFSSIAVNTPRHSGFAQQDHPYCCLPLLSWSLTIGFCVSSGTNFASQIQHVIAVAVGDACGKHSATIFSKYAQHSSHVLNPNNI